MPPIRLRAWFLVLLSAVLQIIIFPMAGPAPVWRESLSWIAMVPLLLGLLSDGRRIGPMRLRDFALLGYFCGFVWYLGSCYWVYDTMHLYGGLSSVAAFGILVLFCLYLGLYHALFAFLLGVVRCYTPLRRSGALIAAPFLWVAVELARSRITSFPWDVLGVTQVDNTMMTAMAPVGGAMLLSFVVIVVNAQIASAWLFETQRMRLQALAIGGGLALVFIMGGALGFGAPALEEGSETAVLLQPNLDVGATAAPQAGASALQDAMRLSLSQRQVARRAITLWPESPAPITTDDPVLRQAWMLLASRTGAPVIAGALGREPAIGGSKVYNSAALIDPESGYVGHYDKIHLVPFGEYVPFASVFSFADGLTREVGNFDRGTARTPFYSGGHSYGIFICYESIFGDEVRQLSLRGADVLVNLSNDGWYGDTSAPFQHIAMARMRAIENRRWLLRDTNTGITASIDPYGRILDRVPRHTQTAAVVRFDYLHDVTFYAKNGDLFGYLCAMVTAVLMVWAAVRYLQRADADVK